jgi:hypothetical protein
MTKILLADNKKSLEAVGIKILRFFFKFLASLLLGFPLTAPAAPVANRNPGFLETAIQLNGEILGAAECFIVFRNFVHETIGMLEKSEESPLAARSRSRRNC